MRDFYEILGVSRDANEEDIKRAYRRLAREHHPDKNGGDKESEERFKEVTVAYETLRDPERRRNYDVYGSQMGAGGGGNPGDFFGGNIGDIFENFFGSAFGNSFSGGSRDRRRGHDFEVTLQLEFEEAVFGAQKEIAVRIPVNCGTCSGSGAQPGTVPSTCQNCQGTGQVRRVSQSILGRMVTSAACDRCHGEGRLISTPCKDCRGEGRKTEEKRYAVEIPAGVDDGATLRLPGKGPAGPRGGVPGDLYVHLSVRPSERFKRAGYDVAAELPISISQAALGTTLSFQTLDDEEEVVIPAGTQAGRVIRLRGKGIPQLQGRARGDLLIQVVVSTPVDLSEEEVLLFKQLAEIRGEVVGDGSDHGLFSKIRSAFK